MSLRTSSRRRSRLNSASIQVERRWKPTPLVAILIAGLIVGFGFGAVRSRTGGNRTQIEDQYMLLTSQLYGQGVPISQIRDRLASLGYSNPSVAVLQIADRLATTPDPVQQGQANQLRNFANALVSGAAAPTVQATVLAGSPTVISVESPTPQESPAAAAPAVAAVPSVAPTTSPTTAQTPVIATPAPAPTATVVQAAPKPSSGGTVGTIHTADRQPAVLRQNPTQKSKALAIIPFGAKVTILGIQVGEAIDPVQPNWYHIRYRNFEGYVYFKLIVAGG